MQNTISTTSCQNQALALTKSMTFSLKILSMSHQELVHEVDRMSLENPALSLKGSKNNNLFIDLETQADEKTVDLEILIVDEVLKNISASGYSQQKKSFFCYVVHHFLDDRLFLKKKELVQKYSDKKYFCWIDSLKKFGPPGFGASCIQERFKYQLERYGLKNSLAYKIIDESWKLFLSQNYLKIEKSFRIKRPEIDCAISIIKKYCRTEISAQKLKNDDQTVLYRADLILRDSGVVILNDDSDYLQSIKICPKFQQLTYAQKDKETKEYCTAQISSVKQLVLSIRKRNETLLHIANTLVKLSRSISENRVLLCKKITLKMLSERLPYSQSTISRALKNKTILTVHGIKMIHVFFKKSKLRC